MYGSNPALISQMQLQITRNRDDGSRLARIALQKYRDALTHAWWAQLWSAFSRRNGTLLSLQQVRATSKVGNAHYAGTRSVSIAHIRGSEGRCADFDAQFRPLKSHGRDRWLSVAEAWQQGVPLPPVELFQVGDTYFVRDGHHRISVARAFGQESIDAEVTVLAASGMDCHPER